MNKCKDCNQCNIYKVREYIIYNFKGYDMTLECCACIVNFSLRFLSGFLNDYNNADKFEELEESFNSWKDRNND